MEGFVYVIESPSNIDLLDGRTEGHALTESLKLAKIPSWYSLAADKASLSVALGERLNQAWQYWQKSPVLHLSMHGSPDGIQLTSGEFITWHELRTMLIPLMNAMQGGLLVCMSTCFGSSGCRMAMYNDSSATFWGLVGNSLATPWADAAVGYISFYHLLFRGVEIGCCVESMKVASGNHNFQLHSGHNLQAQWLDYIQNNSTGLGQRISEASKQSVI